MIFKTPPNSRLRLLRAAALCLLCLSLVARAQQQPTTEQTDDVVRITTELVQTDVMVFDKQGRFVDGLRPEQFELQVGGKQQSVSFFERVTAGSRQEAAQLSKTRARALNQAPPPRASENEQAERGRLIFFFLDDLHLSAASLARARQGLQRFVDNSLNPNDQAAIVSSSGQVGFLQQLTDNSAVLHAAIKRLGYKQNPEAYTGNTQISEYMASQVMDFGNRELYAYLLESIKLEQQMGPGNRQGDHRLAASYSSTTYLRNRLQQVNSQGRITTADTLSSLRSLMLSSSSLTGRKLVFFLSDGFIVNERKAGALEMLHSVTEAAARAGAVVYTMDLRGTVFGIGSGVDASSNGYADLSARRVGLASGEVNATREPLQLIADETGGRAIFNNNSIDDGILQAIRETSDYYLLAWRPDSAELRDGRARLRVFVKGRPDLRVRLRSTSFNAPATEAAQPEGAKESEPAKAPAAKAKTIEASKMEAGKAEANVKTKTEEASGKTKAEHAPTSAQVADAELIAALGSLYPQRGLPASVAAGYLNTREQGAILKISMQTERTAFRFDSLDESQKALVDVLGAAIDDRGQFMSFKQVLTITPDAAGDAARQLVVWHQQLNLKPGLYQVRVALRERNTGRVGSCMQWIEIPDLSKNNLALSSLFLGERKSETTTQGTAGAQAVMVDVDHRFARSSVLRFQTYVYNAAHGTGASPDVWIQAQVLRSNQPLMTVAPVQVPLTNDVARLPFWSEIALDQLPPGRYVLQVTATDRTQQRTAAERVSFNVE